MKICRHCNTTYDDLIDFCFRDGLQLVEMKGEETESHTGFESPGQVFSSSLSGFGIPSVDDMLSVSGPRLGRVVQSPVSLVDVDEDDTPTIPNLPMASNETVEEPKIVESTTFFRREELEIDDFEEEESTLGGNVVSPAFGNHLKPAPSVPVPLPRADETLPGFLPPPESQDSVLNLPPVEPETPSGGKGIWIAIVGIVGGLMIMAILAILIFSPWFTDDSDSPDPDPVDDQGVNAQQKEGSGSLTGTTQQEPEPEKSVEEAEPSDVVPEKEELDLSAPNEDAAKPELMEAKPPQKNKQRSSRTNVPARPDPNPGSDPGSEPEADVTQNQKAANNLQWGAEETRVGRVTIASPASARVFIDGEDKGSGPMVLDLPYGNYKIWIELNGQSSPPKFLDLKTSSDVVTFQSLN